jgi:hypothetical protein
MIRQYVIAVSFVVTLGEGITRADSVQINTGGQACVPASGDTNSLYLAGDGIYGSTSTHAQVTCPLTWWDSTTYTERLSASYLYVTYKDGNAASSADGEFLCETVARDEYGDLYFGPATCSCTTAGGCSTGCTNTYSTTRGSLTVSYPSDTYWDNVSLQCDIPGLSSASVSSFLVGYGLEYETSP